MWLLNFFLEAGSEIIWKPSNKITSPYLFLDRLNKFQLHEFKGFEDKKFINLIKNCDKFITKECLPFYGPHSFADKVYSLGWSGESATLNTRASINIEDGYKYHFIEELYFPLYEKLGYKNIEGNSPKYYFLNSITKEQVFEELNLDPSQKYATFFGSAIGDLVGEREKILNHIIEYCNDNKINIIFKNKMKFGDKKPKQINCKYFYKGDDFWYHQGLLLQTISEFSIGLPTSSCVESETLGTRFISFWGHPKLKGEELINDIIKYGRAYRIAQGNNTFRIYPEDKFDEETKMKLEDFLERDVKYDFNKKFEIHPLLKELI